MTTESETVKPKQPAKPWHPVLFLALMAGAILFWPLGAVGLVAVATDSEWRRLQALCVLWGGVIGFFWGWQFLWPI